MIHVPHNPFNDNDKIFRQVKMVESAMSSLQLRNLSAHASVLSAIAHSSPAQAKMILRDPSDGLVRALSTAVRILHKRGRLPNVKGRHQGRINTLLSPSSAIKSKRRVISSQQGTGFFQEISKSLGNLAPLIPVIAAL
jgi:hypothetical protein